MAGCISIHDDWSMQYTGCTCAFIGELTSQLETSLDHHGPAHMYQWASVGNGTMTKDCYI